MSKHFLNFISQAAWFLITILFCILCIPLLPFLLLEIIFDSENYDSSRDYYHRYL